MNERKKNKNIKQEILVSVIIPVYNSAKYLPQCISTLLGQSLKPVEFIFVDDGSIDNSIDILAAYQKQDDRIRIIKQKNLFAGIARNRGMSEAKGKYIIFVDSDDFFERNMLRDAYYFAEKYKTDIVIFNYWMYDDRTKKRFNHRITGSFHFPRGLFSARDLGNNALRVCLAAPWNKLFLRSFIDNNGLYYPSLKKCEDTYFTQMGIALARRMYYINKRFVNYRINNKKSSQGNTDLERRSWIDSGIQVRRGLIEAGIYNGNIKISQINDAIRLVNNGLSYPYTRESIEDYYHYAKSHLMELFSSNEDFQKDYTVNNIYISQSFTDFLCRQMQDISIERDNYYVNRSNMEVVIGKGILKYPKKIYRLISYCLQKLL